MPRTISGQPLKRSIPIKPQQVIHSIDHAIDLAILAKHIEDLGTLPDGVQKNMVRTTVTRWNRLLI